MDPKKWQRIAEVLVELMLVGSGVDYSAFYMFTEDFRERIKLHPNIYEDTWRKNLDVVATMPSFIFENVWGEQCMLYVKSLSSEDFFKLQKKKDFPNIYRWSGMQAVIDLWKPFVIFFVVEEKNRASFHLWPITDFLSEYSLDEMPFALCAINECSAEWGFDSKVVTLCERAINLIECEKEPMPELKLEEKVPPEERKARIAELIVEYMFLASGREIYRMGMEWIQPAVCKVIRKGKNIYTDSTQLQAISSIPDFLVKLDGGLALLIEVKYRQQGCFFPSDVEKLGSVTLSRNHWNVPLILFSHNLTAPYARGRFIEVIQPGDDFDPDRNPINPQGVDEQPWGINAAVLKRCEDLAKIYSKFPWGNGKNRS